MTIVGKDGSVTSTLEAGVVAPDLWLGVVALSAPPLPSPISTTPVQSVGLICCTKVVSKRSPSLILDENRRMSETYVKRS